LRITKRRYMARGKTWNQTVKSCKSWRIRHFYRYFFSAIGLNLAATHASKI